MGYTCNTIYDRNVIMVAHRLDGRQQYTSAGVLLWVEYAECFPSALVSPPANSCNIISCPCVEKRRLCAHINTLSFSMKVVGQHKGGIFLTDIGGGGAEMESKSSARILGYPSWLGHTSPKLSE